MLLTGRLDEVKMSVSDVTRTEPHMISDSENDIPLPGKKKRVARKSKPAPVEPPAAIASVANAPTPQPPVVPVNTTQDSRELAEMRAMFKEIKGLTEKNAAYVELIAEKEKVRLTKSSTKTKPVQLVAEAVSDPAATNVEDVECPMTEFDNQYVHGDPGFEPWAVFQNQTDEGWQTEEEGEVDDYYIDDSVFVSEPQPRSLAECLKQAAKADAAQAAASTEPIASTSTASTDKVETDKTKRTVFTLSDNLREGVLHSELRELYKKFRKPTKPRVVVDNDVAGAIAHFYAFNKPKKALNELTRQYTGIKNVPEAQVQKLNEEIRFIDARKHAEESMLWASKGVVAALTAIAPTLAIVLSRGKGDHELDEQALKMLDAVKILVFTHSQLTGDRLQNVKKVVNTVLGKEVIKPKTDAYGEKELPTDLLLGDDLAEKNKKIIKSARASDTVMNTALAPRKWRRSSDYYQRSYNSSVRARGQWNLRARFGTRGMPYSWNARQAMQSRFNRPSGGYGNTQLPNNNMRGARGRGAPQAQRGFQK